MIIKDTSQDINEVIICEKNKKSSILREKICEKIPELINIGFYFIVNGNKLDENKTIEENRIKMNDVMLLIKTIVTVTFKDSSGQLNCINIKIENNKKCSELIKELYKKNRNLKEENYDFICNSNKLNPNLTIFENEINDNDIIFINKSIPIFSKISVRIKDTSQNIDEIIKCEKSEQASILKEKIIEKKQELINTNFYFLFNGNKIDEEKTIKENKIEDEDVLLLIKNDESIPNNYISNMIAIIIKLIEKGFQYAFICKRSDRFSTVLEKLYKQRKEYRDQNKELIIRNKITDNNSTFEENKIIDINLTLEENNIKDGDIIEYKIKEEEEEEEDPNEISVIFRNAKFKTSLICNKKDIFKDLKDKFLEKKKEYKNVFFVANGNIVDTNKSIEENKIKDNDNIFVSDY